jgi:hypothetical protein
MKTLKNVLIGMLLIVPLLLPVRSRAGGFTDWLHGFFQQRAPENHQVQPSGANDRFRSVNDRYRSYDPYAYRNGRPGDANSVPIDGGLVILLAAGLLFGAKKMYDQKTRLAAEVKR